ncbi:hypothetical protein GGU10DRAFT_249993, partial [Lentinula aff. detonsa]
SQENLKTIGHKNGTRDKEDLSYWKELRVFLGTGEYPSRLNNDKARLRFRKRARRFFLQDGRIWLAPKLNSDRLPRLVIELMEKRKYLIARAHNEVGHRGQDATY